MREFDTLKTKNMQMPFRYRLFFVNLFFLYVVCVVFLWYNSYEEGDFLETLL